MFDVAPTELLLVAAVALIVIGPKDLPKAMRFVGYWVGRARTVARQFRSGFDEMIREAEFAEMEQKWKSENERIMREHPAGALPAPKDDAVTGAETASGDLTPPALIEQEASDHVDAEGAPVMVEKPVVEAAAALVDPGSPLSPEAEKPVAPS